MLIVKYRKIFFIFSATIIGFLLFAFVVWGLPLGIDFTGGSLTEVSYENERPTKDRISGELESLSIGNYSLRESGEDTFILRTRDLADAERASVETALSLQGTAPLVVERYASIGPIIGTELRNKAIIAISIVVLAIVVFIAFTFRHVSRPVSSWKYGFIAIVALIHDILIPTGIFAVMGRFAGAEVDALFVMALLAILGYSVNDTIVVFDRVRENLRDNEERNRREDFELTVGKSLNQTLVRSINTSLTTAFVLIALVILGAPATQYFALTLFAGVIAGTYSSICLATPLLVWVKERQDKNER